MYDHRYVMTVLVSEVTLFSLF